MRESGIKLPRSLSGVEMRKRQAGHMEGPPQAPGAPRPNTCCLCWCGCCKCLCKASNGRCRRPSGSSSRVASVWLASRRVNEGQNDDRIERSGRETCTKLDSIEGTEEHFEEMGTWARSFEMMMRSLEGREIFREFLRSEYSEENLLFWLSCEELKKETDPVTVDEKARIIYEDYVSILSPKEVSLDSRVREGINQSLTEPSNLMYEEAQLQIYTLMHRDSFPRFLNSSVYRDLQANRRRSSLDT
ncbi:hypothetical protein NHX12_022777 [Muraenolepis orangiensis]|uniref:RGS domain-containing protein n=1 Tax=Muraenolepis orangiensis TaxID=630683 RepID=A0A9Q0ESF6_9TELE|nr:hypothetical protein NHX12_022777 [Muraenolepis orangiensis]